MDDSNSTSPNHKKYREALKRYDIAVDYERDNIQAAMNDLEFRIGEQWPVSARRERENTDRPVLTLNRIPQFVRQVTGDLRQTRPAIKVRGADAEADPETAELLTGLIRNIENQSDAKAAYYAGADNQVTAGLGHWRVNSRYIADDVFEQDLVIEPIPNSIQIVWDPDSKLVTREDADYCFVPVEMTKEMFEATWPKAEPIDFERELFFDEQRQWFSTDTVTVAEYWEKQDVKKTLAQLEDGRVIDITDMEDSEVEFLAPKQVVERDSFKVVRYMMNGNEFLDDGVEWPGKYIPVIPCIGEEVETGKKCYRHGVVRFLKDPQQLYNYWRTAQTEQIALQPKSPFIGTHKMFSKNKQQWENANYSTMSTLAYEPDPAAPTGRPERSTPPQPAAGLSEQVAQTAEEMNAVVGIYPAALGQQSNETSGIAIRQRQQEGDVGTFVYMDNFARAVGHTGKVLIDLIPFFYDTERVVRILNEDGTEAYEAINQVVMSPEGPIVLHDLSAGKYDVVAQIGPSYTTKRQEAAEGMREFLSSMPDVAPLVADLFVKSQDWPMADEIAERIRKQLPPGIVEQDDDEEPQGPTPEQIAQQEASAAEQALVQREQERQDAEVQIKAADSATKRMKAEADSEAELAKIALDAKQSEEELDLERDKLALETVQATESRTNGAAPPT